MKHKSNRTEIKIDFFIAQIAKFQRPTSRIMCKLMRNVLFLFFYIFIIIIFTVKAFFFFEPMTAGFFLIDLRLNLVFLALVPARKQFTG